MQTYDTVLPLAQGLCCLLIGMSPLALYYIEDPFSFSVNDLRTNFGLDSHQFFDLGYFFLYYLFHPIFQGHG